MPFIHRRALKGLHLKEEPKGMGRISFNKISPKDLLSREELQKKNLRIFYLRKRASGTLI